MKRTRQLLSNTLRIAVRCWCTSWSNSQPRVVLGHRWSLVVVGGSCASSFGRQYLLSSFCYAASRLLYRCVRLMYSNSYLLLLNNNDELYCLLERFFYRFVGIWEVQFFTRGVAERHHVWTLDPRQSAKMGKIGSKISLCRCDVLFIIVWRNRLSSQGTFSSRVPFFPRPPESAKKQKAKCRRCAVLIWNRIW